MLSWLRRLFGGARPPVEPELARQSRAANPDARHQATVALGSVPEPWAAQRLLELLADSHPVVRAAARESLGRQGRNALPVLVTGLNHADPEVGAAAADLLGELGDPATIERLLTTLKYGARPVQMAAWRALKKMGPAARPALEAARDDTNPWVRQQVEALLAQGTG